MAEKYSKLRKMMLETIKDRLESDIKKVENDVLSTYDELMQDPEFKKKHEKSYYELLLSELSLEDHELNEEIFLDRFGFKNHNEILQHIINLIKNSGLPKCELIEKLVITYEQLDSLENGNLYEFLIFTLIRYHYILYDNEISIEKRLLSFLIRLGPNQGNLIDLVQENIKEEYFHSNICKNIFKVYFKNYDYENQFPYDTLSLFSELNKEERILFFDIIDFKINPKRFRESIIESIQSILDRNWMKKREEIKIHIQSVPCSDDETLELVKKFDELKENPPKIKNLN